jgi:carbonic anhydrase/acetyltransferase-like protein (isoleucine patch superfamily)
MGRPSSTARRSATSASWPRGRSSPEGMEVPPRSLVMGLPAKVRRPITEEERQGPALYAPELLRIQVRRTSPRREGR